MILDNKLTLDVVSLFNFLNKNAFNIQKIIFYVHWHIQFYISFTSAAP